MKKITVILIACFFGLNSQAQIWQKVGSTLNIIDGTDSLPIPNAFSKYTTALLKNIRGNVGVSTNSHDSVLVYDELTKSIRKKLLSGGGGGATDTTNKFVNTIEAVNDSTFRFNKGGTYTNISVKGATDRLTNSLNNYVTLGTDQTITANKVFNGTLGIGNSPFAAEKFHVTGNSLFNGEVNVRYGWNLNIMDGGYLTLKGSVLYYNPIGSNYSQVYNSGGTVGVSNTNLILADGQGGTVYVENGKMGVKKINPTVELDVVGNAQITGNVKIGIGTNNSAKLEVVSNTQGAIPAPLNDERFVASNILNPTKGLHVIDSVSGILMRWQGFEWVKYDAQQFNRTSICFYNTFQGFATQSILGGQHLDIANGSAFEDFTLNVSTITQDGYVFSVFNEETTYAATFTGQTVYQLNGTTVITSIPPGSHWTFRRMNGKLRKIN